MAEIKGSFCWDELATSDQAGAKRFYQELVGWRVKEEAMPAGGSYTMWHVGETAAAGMRGLEPQAKMPPHWGCYIDVADAAKTAKRATELGATLVAPPFDMGGMGTSAVIQDPTGAFFSLWQAKSPMPAPNFPQGTVGAVCWHELLTSNVDRAAGFYSKLFGWQAKAMPMPGMTYTVCSLGEKQLGGIMEFNDAMKQMKVPPMWMIYLSVADRDKSIAQATKLGGKALSPPMEAPDVGKFVTLQDPQGAVFGVISP